MSILVCLQLVSSETITSTEANVKATSRMHMENEVATAEPYVSPSATMEATAEPYVSPSVTVKATAEPYSQVSPSTTAKARAEPYMSTSATVKAIAEPNVSPSAKMETTAEPYVSPSATVKATTEPYVFPSATTEAMIETYMSPNAKIEATIKMNRSPAATADAATEQSKSPTALITTALITEHQDEHASLKRPKDVTMVTSKEAVATDSHTLKPLTTTALAITSDISTSTGESTKSHDPETSATEVSMSTDAIQLSMSDSVTKEMSSGKEGFSFLKSTFSVNLPSNIINVIHE